MLLVPPSSGTEAIQVAEFVRRLRPEPRHAFLTLRALVVSLGPDVSERVEAAQVTYSRRDEPFLRVELVRTRLLAAFPAGLALHDPMGRLLRRGEQRYFKLDAPDHLDGHLQEFVRKAYASARRL